MLLAFAVVVACAWLVFGSHRTVEGGCLRVWTASKQLAMPWIRLREIPLPFVGP